MVASSGDDGTRGGNYADGLRISDTAPAAPITAAVASSARHRPPATRLTLIVKRVVKALDVSSHRAPGLLDVRSFQRSRGRKDDLGV